MTLLQYNSPHDQDIVFGSSRLAQSSKWEGIGLAHPLNMNLAMETICSARMAVREDLHGTTLDSKLKFTKNLETTPRTTKTIPNLPMRRRFPYHTHLTIFTPLNRTHKCVHIPTAHSYLQTIMALATLQAPKCIALV